MADLKATAKWLKQSATDSYITDEQTSHLLLAAQALEALAWQAEVGAKVKQCWSGERWFCHVGDGEYVADTPLGALLAAMEGEKDD